MFVPWRGARASATKVLIVITDGEKTERLRYRDVIPEAEREGIVRYAIGVRRAPGWDFLFLLSMHISILL